ncbi:hypothetical protein Shal_4056 [Shewanella halifaxensis HAW-EB4]|uniref:Uncharacterized protein n=1 Tax=Shewanella halifaxensis (strain HAW-EB4) TaxID=458817 RepID=B0TKL0_SHEHH|nr:hypothetical protein [Shewanella halifaxensis]ABZ78596.1 hypothetical protein Shal_4056 [Shewanella halifaxensis HAW-EB4]
MPTINDNKQTKKKVQNSNKATKQRRGFGSICPSIDSTTDIDCDGNVRQVEYEVISEQTLAISKVSIEEGGLISAKGGESSLLSSVLHGLVNLENNRTYLSDERISKWGRLCNEALKFKRIVIYMSVELDLPQTIGMTQRAYFEKYFNFADYEVSKTLRNVQTLVLLKFGVISIHELENRQCLSDLGDENDLVLNSYSIIRSESGDLHLQNIYEECNRIVAENKSIKKVTGKLINDVNKVALQSEVLCQTIESGAIEEYERVDSILPFIDKSGVETTKRNINVGTALESLTDYWEKTKSVSKCLTEYSPESINEMKKRARLLVEAVEELEN